MNVLNVLLSWSGATSRSIASILRERLSTSFPSVNVWMSETDVPSGANWSFTVAEALEHTQFGIICVTAENMNAPWLMFEAGALSKALGNAVVIPYLIGVKQADVSGPLAQFQCVRANMEGTLKLFRAIQAAANLTTEAADQAFKSSWSLIANALFFREHDFSGSKVQRLAMSIVNANEEDDDVPGWLFGVLPGAYSIGFDFECASWENEGIIFARASRRRKTLVRVEPNQKPPARLEDWPWTRIASCRNHTDPRVQSLTISEDSALFITAAHKQGTPNPFLRWCPSDPRNAALEAAILTVSFEDEAGGISSMKIQAQDPSMLKWFSCRGLI